MIRSFIFAAALFAIAAPSPAAAQPDAAERIEADVTFLADDLLEGREAGTRGFDLAAKYVATRFDALGLAPSATGRLQPVPLARGELNPRRISSITIGGHRYDNGDHAVLLPDASEAAIDGTAAMVFVGYGLDDKAMRFDDYRGLDARGKVVVVLDGMPDGLPSEIAAVLSRSKADIAAAHGAVGIITLSTPASSATTPWRTDLARLSSATMRWIGPDGRPANATAALRLNAKLDVEASARLLDGTPLAGPRLSAALADRTARPTGFALPGTVRVQRFSSITRLASANVVGLLPGRDPKLANEVIVLSAHLDHLGIVSATADDRIANGALDNAIGVAAMLETARALSMAPRRPRRTILFVALTGEEKGLLGSQYLAAFPPVPGKRILADVNLDMPVLLFPFTDVVAYGSEHSTMRPIIARAARSMNIALSADPEPKQNRFVRSDQYSFVRQGIPAVVLKPGFANGGEVAITAFVRDKYHQVGDDLSAPIDWASSARFARLNFLVASALADDLASPRWYAGDYFGHRFAPAAPKAVRQ